MCTACRIMCGRIMCVVSCVVVLCGRCRAPSSEVTPMMRACSYLAMNEAHIVAGIDTQASNALCTTTQKNVHTSTRTHAHTHTHTQKDSEAQSGREKLPQTQAPRDIYRHYSVTKDLYVTDSSLSLSLSR